MSEKNQHYKKSLRYYNIDDIPDDTIGIYGFWRKDNGRCIYIGQAKDQSIRTRVKQEYDKSHNSELREWIRLFGSYLEFCYLAVPHDKMHKVDDLENKFIDLWNPETNIRNKRR